MGYTALYRKWRPIIFEDVIGQSHVTKTIKNQIISGSIAHAYLFSGTRGTGKTSTAKIFSRAVNCLEPIDANPCNKCEICTGILNESIMDVIEIDAASNNGVDDIRELRENVKYPPSKAKYKVYIIDEVHMLSKGAFNALLKTLEEPPSYVIFILATTEPHKIPATIHSRCQRFEMKRVTYDLIESHLKMICDNGNFEFEDEAIKLVVRNSDGSVRDALSILDQCMSFTEGILTHKLVLETLGMISLEHIFDLTEMIIAENTFGTMSVIDNLSKNGKDLLVFIKDYIEYLRNLMLIKVSNDLDSLIDLSKENVEMMVEQSKKLTLNNIIRWIQVLSELESEMKWSSQPRVLLEMGMIKLIRPELDQTVEGLQARVEKLEAALRSGRITTETLEPKVNNQVTKNITQRVNTNKQEKKEELVEETSYKGNAEGVTLEMVKSKWSEILSVIKKKKIATHALLIEGKLVRYSGNTLTLAFDEGFGFHKVAVEKPENKKLIESVISSEFGGNIVVDCIESNTICEQDCCDNTETNMVDEVTQFFEGYSDKLKIIE